MKSGNQSKRELRQGRAALRSKLSIAISLVCIANLAHAEVQFHPSAEISATWIDNIDLAGDGLPKESEYVLQVTPGFEFTQKSQRFNSSVNYKMQNLFYGKESDRNSTYHQLGAAGNVEALRGYFYVEGSGSYLQQVIDPSQRTNTNLLFDVANVTDTLTAQITPYFHHEFDEVLTDVRYTRGVVRYKKETFGLNALQDVDTEIRQARIGSADDLGRFTWEARYEYQQANYDISPPFRFESASGEIGLLVTRTVRLLGRGGAESDPVRNSSEAGLDETWWEAGFRWQPSTRTRVQALYGKHSYGKTYNVTVSHEARLVELIGTYVEGPTTQAQELTLRPATQAQAQQPGQTLQNSILAVGEDNFNRVTADVYIRKDLDARLRVKGQRTEVELNVFDYKRTYVSSGAEEHSRGGGLNITRKLSGGFDLTVSGRLSDSDLIAGTAPSTSGAVLAPYDYREVLYSAGVKKRVTKHISSSLIANRVRRTGNINYEANWVTLGVKGEF